MDYCTEMRFYGLPEDWVLNLTVCFLNLLLPGLTLNFYLVDHDVFMYIGPSDGLKSNLILSG